MVILKSFSPQFGVIKHEQPSTKLFVSEREIGCGTLYIAESKLSWRENATGEGFSLLYPYISVHGVSRDVEQFGSECLFLMVDTYLYGHGSHMEVNGVGVTQMKFVPDDKGQLDAMFQAMTHCQSRHPNPPPDPCSEGVVGVLLDRAFGNALLLGCQCWNEDDDEYFDADEEGDNIFTAADSGYIEDHETTNWFHQRDEDETDGQFVDAEDD